MLRCSSLVLLVLVLAFPPPSDARRPGTRLSFRIRPTEQELAPLPPGVALVPPPLRSSVDPVPTADLVPGDTLQPGGSPVDRDGTPPAKACGKYTETDIRPLRQQWDSGNGYCGETSVQMTAMTRGIWISQHTARKLGVASGANHPDLLFDERKQPVSAMSGVYGVAKMLGLYQPADSYWYSDNMTMSGNVLNPGPSAFAAWIKRNVLAGRPVITGVRVSYGSYPDYDHIIPIFGICYNNANKLKTNDVFVMTDDYLSELHHTPDDKYFYAPYQGCGYTGCLPSDYYDYGVAVGPLNVPANVYYPTKLALTGWSDGSGAQYEPGEFQDSGRTASYTLTVSGLTAGRKYRLYRTTGLFPNFQIPQSSTALAAACKTQGTGCSSIFFTASGATVTFTDASTGSIAGTPELGQFSARGVTYFLVVRSAS